MSISATGVITVLNDLRGRPLVTVRRPPKGYVMYILMRYKDMTESDKDIVRAAYEIASSHSVDGIELGESTKDIEGFLEFSENRLCG